MKPYYESGGITIYHGDCREVLPGISGVACVVSSPPYNQLGSRIGNPGTLWRSRSGGLGFVEAVRERGYADDMDEIEYQAWQSDVFSAAARSCLPSASLFYNHQIRWRDGTMLHPMVWFRPVGWHHRSEIIWDRAGGMMFNARMFCRFDERIIWFVMSQDDFVWNQECVGMGTVWRIPREQNKEHPVAFPLEIPSRCIAATTVHGGIVLDPFCGSGTTLRAAKNLGRRAIGIEIEERYAEIAAERLSQEVFDFSPALGASGEETS